MKDLWNISFWIIVFIIWSLSFSLKKKKKYCPKSLKALITGPNLNQRFTRVSVSLRCHHGWCCKSNLFIFGHLDRWKMRPLDCIYELYHDLNWTLCVPEICQNLFPAPIIFQNHLCSGTLPNVSFTTNALLWILWKCSKQMHWVTHVIESLWIQNQ